MTLTWLTDHIYIAPSSIDKLGIFSARDTQAGATIYHVSGTYMRNAFSAEFAQIGPNWIGVSKEVWLNPAPNNPMNYMNHACEPNAIVSDGPRVIALCDIPAHTEILMDYSTTEIDPYWEMPCRCNRPTCRSTITAFQFLPAQLRERYQPVMLKTLLADVPFAASKG